MALLRKVLFVTLCTAATTAAVYGQAEPTATASNGYGQFALPDVGGSLRYSLSASEVVLTGYNGTTGSGVSTYTNLSGDLAYLSHSDRHPFSVVYAGGYLFGSSSFPSYAYQSLSFSQALHTRDWDFIVADSVAYLPQTPVGSLSGIPGAGDLGIPSVQVNSTPGLDILTTYATRVSNTVSGTVSRRITASTSLSITGADSLQRFTGSSTNFQGINNDQQSANAALQHRFDERTTAGVGYTFTNSSFQSTLLGPGSYGYQSHTAQGLFSRQLTRKLSLAVGAGPQWVVQGSNAGVASGTSVSLSANAGLNYTGRNFVSSISYARGVNNGNGVVVGSRQDSLVANVSRSFDRIYNVSGLVGYNHGQQLTTSLLPNYSSSGVVAGGQFSVQVSRPISVFAGYTLQRQLFTGQSPAGIAFNGLTQYLTFGIRFAPKPLIDRK